MRPEEKDAAYVWDIFNAAKRTSAFVADMNCSMFEHDARTYYAVVAQLQIIGEATKRLSSGFRDAHPEIPWQHMARMRDWLIHHSDRIRLDVIWDTVQKDIPELIFFLEALLPSVEKPNDDQPDTKDSL